MIIGKLTFSNVKNNHLLYNDDSGLNLYSGQVPRVSHVVS